MTLLVPTRRGFLAGLGAALAAPAIVRASSIMPVKALSPYYYSGYGELNEAALENAIIQIRAIRDTNALRIRDALYPGVRDWFERQWATGAHEDLFT